MEPMEGSGGMSTARVEEPARAGVYHGSCSAARGIKVTVKMEPMDGSGGSRMSLARVEEPDMLTDCVVKEERELMDVEEWLNTEPSWSDSAGSCGVSEAAALAGLHTDYVVKDELVLGPERPHRPDVGLQVIDWALGVADGQPISDCDMSSTSTQAPISHASSSDAPGHKVSSEEHQPSVETLKGNTAAESISSGHHFVLVTEKNNKKNKQHRTPTSPNRDEDIKRKKNEHIISGSDYGTKKAEDILCEGWYKSLETESDKDCENDCEQTPVDVTSEQSAILPPLTEGARQWLQNEDAEADRTIQAMLPIDDLTFDWTSDRMAFTRQRETLTATPGPTFDFGGDSPLDIFRKNFDDDLLDLIVTQTNKYSKFLIDKITAEHSRLIKWTNTDRGEIVVFLAIRILQGLVPLTVEADYWKENGYLTLKYFKNLMTYNRFTMLKRLLHFTDNLTDTTGLSTSQRKLRKIQPVLDHLNRKFRSLYLPKQNIAIDDSLLKWHRRLSFVQKIATKAAKVGVKSYELCEFDTGYLWSFFVYTDDTSTTERQDSDSDIVELTDDVQASTSSLPPPSSNATAQIVQNLAKPLLGYGYTLIMDSFYNSPLLARYLKSQKTDCFGTLRVSRESVPEAIKLFAKADMRVGEMLQTYSKDMTIMLWRDTNVVSMISTFHNGEAGGKEKYGRFKYMPQVVLDYNLSMGVDRKDQLLPAPPIETSKNVAWYKKVFRRLLNVTIHNAFVILKSRNANIASHTFRRRLAEEMIKAYLPPRVQCTPVVRFEAISMYPGEKSRPILEGNHFIGQGVSKSIRCVWCKKSRTTYICKQCFVSLCLDACFEEYHTKIINEITTK